MGIKHFFIWFKNNFPECIKAINGEELFEESEIEIDNLCLDMNGIFHTCAQKVYEYGDFERNKSLMVKNRKKTGIKWQTKMFKEVCDRIEFYRKMVNPKKRLILCVDGVAGAAKMAQQRQRRFKAAKDAEKNDNMDFDPTCITPGTKFMSFLTKYMDWYIRLMMSKMPDWKDLEVIISNEKVSGEGEHKIINYIRKYGTENEKYCIHGLDADLIMLSLGTHMPHMFILRENVFKFNEYNILNIGLFSEKLISHLKWEDGKQFRKKSAIDDFIFMCFLVGNDFVPSIPTIAILEGGIDIMLDVYKNTGKAYGHLTRVCNRDDPLLVFRTDSLGVFLGSLSQYEKGLMEEKMEKKDTFFEDLILKNNSTYVEDKWNVNFEGYRNEYYHKKFPKDTNITELCHEYLTGLQWIITYYRRGIPDWSWYYPYFYAPFLKDLAESCKTFKFTQFVENEPSSPFLQLMSVLPPQSSHLLPQPFANLITNKTSSISKYYPTEFEIDLSGKRREWEGIVIIPVANFSEIKKEYDKYVDKLSDNEKRLNITGSTFIYRYSDRDSYFFKSFYGNISDCKVNSTKFDI